MAGASRVLLALAVVACGGDDPGTDLVVSRTTVDFEIVRVGATGGPQRITVTNESAAATNALLVDLSNPDDYRLVGDTCTATTLAPAATCELTVTATPTIEGERVATVTVTAQAASPVGVELSTRAVDPQPAVLEISPLSFDFPATIAGVSSAPTTITVYNTGELPTGELTVRPVVTDDVRFEVQASTCTGSLDFNSSCTVDVTFTPLGAGDHAGTLVVSDANGSTASADLTGEGLAVPTLTVTPATHEFGSTAVGNTSSDLELAVSWPGGIESGPLAVTLEDVAGGADQFVVGSDDCTGTSLSSSGGSCHVQVSHRPLAAGSHSIDVVIDSEHGGTHRVRLGGDTFAPELTASQPMANFGSSVASYEAREIFINITNTGGAPTSPLVVTTSDANHFRASECSGETLAPGARCQLRIMFVPQDLELHTGEVTVQSGAAASVTIPVSGTGSLGELLDVSPTEWDFGTVMVGAQSMEASFTVTHVGSRFCPVYVQQWSNYVDYDVLNNTCGFLGPGQTCTFRVRFAPTDVGPLPTQIMVRPQHGYGGTVELSGTGVIASR